MWQSSSKNIIVLLFFINSIVDLVYIDYGVV